MCVFTPKKRISQKGRWFIQEFPFFGAFLSFHVSLLGSLLSRSPYLVVGLSPIMSCEVPIPQWKHGIRKVTSPGRKKQTANTKKHPCQHGNPTSPLPRNPHGLFQPRPKKSTSTDKNIRSTFRHLPKKRVKITSIPRHPVVPPEGLMF